MNAVRHRQSRIRQHLHVADPDIPPDHRGDRRCTGCGVMGRPGDAHHLDPAAPLAPPRPLSPDLAAAAHARDAAILGEKEDLE